MMIQKKIEFRALALCPLCNSQFDRNNNKEPRSLFCGHSICSNCVKSSVLKNGKLTCPSCGENYSKQQCSGLKINQFCLSLIDHLESIFGKVCVFQKRLPIQNQRNQVIISPQHVQRKVEMSQQFVKCKNSPCYKMTDLIFCSEECQIQFEEVETKKNEGADPNRSNSDGIFEI